MKFSGSLLTQFALPIITVLVALVTLVCILFPYEDVLVVEVLRIVSGSVLILFLPGYFLTRAFFSSREIDMLERFVLSFALSIAVVPLLMFYGNLLGVAITALSVYIITITIIILSSIYTAFFQQPLGTSNKKEIPG